MNQLSTKFTMMFVLLVLAQVIVFNHLCLFGVAFPLVFIYFIIRLPMTWNPVLCYTLSFLLGLVIDIFSDTQGMNALACTILCAVRKPVLRLYYPREENMEQPSPSVSTLGVDVFFKYLLTMTLIYCALYFIIESFTFFHFGRLLAKIITSTVFTSLLILGIDTLTLHQNAKRL